MTAVNGHVMASSLAIANPNPKALIGPEYLDHLVASETSEDVAILSLDSDGNTSHLSYNALHQAASRLANLIQQHLCSSSRRNTIVPIIIPQSPLLYVSYLSVLKCGAAFCPILPDTPDERVHFIVEDVEAELALCLPETRHKWQNLLPSVQCISVSLEDCLASDKAPFFTSRGARDPSDIAYVMYTSGSTGQPKGVPISHKVVTQSLLAHDEHIPSFSRFFQFAAPTFDVSVFEIFFPWFRSATLTCCERESALADLPGTLGRLAVDAIELTPTVTTTLLRSRAQVPSLKILLTIGEMLHPSIIEEFGGSESQTSILFAMYGPTEASIHCTLRTSVQTSACIQDIGQPLATVTALILSESDVTSSPTILHHGEPGELAISGQLASGYLNRTEQTAAAFIDIPGYGKVYRTGDRALMTTEGDLRILGRLSDGQVKLRGQRVELGEIESVALQADGVDLAVAIVLNDNLILFCCGQPLMQLTAIEARCKEWLPRHMRPGEILILKQDMPRLPSGKVDRKQLEHVYQDYAGTTTTDRDEDLRESSSWIARVVSEEIAVHIHKNQSLWSSGLNSLRAIKIASRLRERYIHVSVSTVLAADSLSHLIAMLEDEAGEPDSVMQTGLVPSIDGHLSSIVRSVEEANVPNDTTPASHKVQCSPMQSAMLAETMRDSSLNFNKIILTATVPLPFTRVLQAFLKIVQLHPILRASFETTHNPDMPFVQLIKSSPSLSESPSLRNPLSLSQGSNEFEFIIIIHHALYDGWSWDLLMKDLNALLGGGSIGARPSYEQFSQLRQQKDKVHRERHLTTWVSMLQRIEFPSLPTLCTRPPRNPSRQRHTSVLSISAGDLEAIAIDLHVNMATIVHAALSVLLAAYTDSENVVTGLVLAGREPVMPHVEEVIGPCLITLPLLVQLHEKASAREIMLHVYQQYMLCLRNSAVTLNDIRNALSISSDTRLFEVLFVWQESPYQGDVNTDQVVITATHDSLDHPLVVEAEPKNGSIYLRTTYDDSRLSQDQVRFIHLQMDAFVESFVHKMDAPVRSVHDNLPKSLTSLHLSSDESEPEDLTLNITKTALQYPDRIALDFVNEFDSTSRIVDREIVTYGQLYQRACNIARKLITKFGLVPEDIVAICCRKSPHLYTVICATILAGMAYLCIDPDTPSIRLQEILHQANARLIVLECPNDTHPSMMLRSSVAMINDLVEELASGESEVLPQPSPSALAYVVFTSGSTGIPKGVLMTRRNLASNLRHLSCVYPYNGSSRLLQSCSQSFDVSVFEIFWTWSCGLTLCAATNDVLFRDIEAFINTLEITHLSMTPSVAALIDPVKVPTVTFLVCAGEPMSAKVFDRWISHGLHQGYGPSETTNICNVRNYYHGTASISNVGQGFPNTTLIVCARRSSSRVSQRLSTSDLKILPRGAVGEIWIGGLQVGRGYTDPELTRLSFFDHPEYGRLFRSGDFGRLLPDNTLMVMGREDDQVKLRGQRVELSEINSRLIKSGHASDSFTLLVPTDTDQQRLVSFWVPKNTAANNASTIQNSMYDHLQDALPAYMIPESLIPISTLPLTSQGKIDRRLLIREYRGMDKDALSAHSPHHSTGHEDRSLTRSEHDITEVLSGIVQIPASRLNVHASFLTYGIDSIRAITFARKLRDTNFVSIEVSDIMKYPSISRLASRLDKKYSLDPSTMRSASEILPSHIKEKSFNHLEARGFHAISIMPCTPLQTAMLAANGTSNNKAYLNHLVYNLLEDAEIIKHAWTAAMERHSLLRTMFILTEHPRHPYLQAVLNQFDLPWKEVTRDNLGIVESPFEQPPYFLRLVERSNSRTQLHLFIHHALYDAEALGILQREIEMYCRGGVLPPPTPFSAYLDFMVSLDSAQSQRFWQRQLCGVVPCHLVNHGHRYSRSDSHALKARRCALRWTNVLTCAKVISTTPLSLFQTALTRLLSGYLQSMDVCFGTVFSGRNVDVPDAEKIVGPCFNTLPTRMRLRHKQTAFDICQSHQDFNVSVLPYQSTSLREIQGLYSTVGEPLFDVLLLVQSEPSKLDSNIWTLVHEQALMAFPLIFEVQLDPDADAIHVFLHDTASTEPEFLDKLLDHYVDQIIEIIGRPSLPSLERLPSPHLREQKPGKVEHRNPFAKSDKTLVQMNETSPTWRQVLDRLQLVSKRPSSKVSADTTIFHFGLDSISAVQMAMLLRKDGYHISASDILNEPRIHDIVTHCEGAKSRTVPDSNEFDLHEFDRKHRNRILDRLSIENSYVEAVWPCTATQIGIISEFLRSDGRCYYNMIRLRINSGIEVDRLRYTIKEISKIHVMLRTGFIDISDAQIPFAMVVYSEAPADIRFSTDSKETSKSTRSLLHDISRPPWYIELREDAEGFKIDLHALHALYDAQSLQTILRDVAAKYRDVPVPEPPSIAKALSLQIANNSLPVDLSRIFKKGRYEIEQTRFPDLNILRDVPSKLLTTALSMESRLGIIQRHCELLNCSLSSAVQAAWAKLLAAYTAQQNVVFGTVMSGRSFNDEALNEVAFPCMNTIPMFASISDTEDPIIQQMADQNAHWQKNPHVSLSNVNRALGAKSVLFDTLIVLQKHSSDELDLPWHVESEIATAEYAVSLEIIPCYDTVKLLLTYNQRVLPTGHATLLLEQYEDILYQLLNLKSKVSRKFRGLNSTRPAVSKLIHEYQGGLHHLVLASAAENPNKIALEFITGINGSIVNRETWTYEQLVREASRVANMLINNGSHSGDRIAVCCEKCPQASFALLGILMAGCSYVAVDPNAPFARRHFVIHDARCQIMLTTAAIARNLDSIQNLKVFCVDDYDLLSQQSTELTRSTDAVSPSDICYCLYTSGTTGTPKGCLISHQSVVQAMLSFSRIFEDHWAEDSRWLQFAAYHFDVSVLEHFWSWKEGICVTVVTHDLLFEDLSGTINKLGITHLDLTPSLARLLTPVSAPSLCRGVFIVGGEAVRQDIIDTWGDFGCLYNFYGPSEVTIGCTVHPRVRRSVKPTNIGHQWDNVGTYVLEPGTESSVLIGAIGELCLSGVLLAEGYLNRPDLTAEKFIFLESNGERVYRTGDLVRMLHDQSFEFLGRIDDQVKLRGQRLEVGEINHVVQQASKYGDVATLVLEHPEQKRHHLVTFLAQQRNTKSTRSTPRVLFEKVDLRCIAELRSRTSDHLPAYMVPTYFITIDHLPLTVNNKVDMKKLRAMYEDAPLAKIRHHQGSQEASEFIEPATYAKFIDVIVQYLGASVESVGQHESLLQLGVDSVSVIGLARAFKAAGFANASVAVIMKKSIVLDLATRLCVSNDGDTDVPGIEHEEALKRIRDFAAAQQSAVRKAFASQGQRIQSVAPCTALQEGMVSRSMVDDSIHPVYMTKFVFQVDPKVDLARLATSWDKLQSQLDILRTRFIPTEDGYAQVVLAPASEHVLKFDYGVSFIRDDPLDTIEKSFESWVRSARLLGQVRPWEVWITQRAQDQKCYMSMFMFHGLYDGISIQLLLQRLFEIYEGTSSKHDTPQFHQVLPLGPLIQSQNAPSFWSEHCQYTQLLQLPSLKNDKTATPEPISCDITIPEVRQVCSDLAVTPQAVFQAIWLLVLADQFGVNPTVGVVSSGRSIEFEGVDQTIGPLFNTLPFTVSSLPKGSCLTDLIHSCHNKNVEMIPYQHTPLSSIRKWLKKPSDQELFDNLFVYQAAAYLAGKTKWPWVELQSSSRIDYPLNVEIQELETHQYRISVSAASELSSSGAQANLLDSFKTRLARLTEASQEILPHVFHAASRRAVDVSKQVKMSSEAVKGDTWSTDALTVRTVLAELAGVQDTSINHHSPTIFELGLDSVDALKVAARLKSRGLSLPVSRILQHPTVGGIAAQYALWQASAHKQDTISSPFDHKQLEWREFLQREGKSSRDVQIILPTTSLQSGLLLEFEKYFHIMVYKIRDQVEIAQFTKAVHAVVQACTMLRTRFAVGEDVEPAFLQIVTKPQTGGRRPQILYQMADFEELKQAVKRFRDNAEITDSAPKFCVISLSNKSNYLIAAMSHASYDAWSLRLMLHYLQRFYEERHNLPDDSLNITKHLQSLQEGRCAGSREFWLEQLTDAIPCLIKTDPLSNQSPAILRRKATKISVNHAHEACKRDGVTLQTLGVTTWTLFLMTLTKQFDVNFGIVVSGRINEETENLVFPTFNTTVFRPRIHAQATSREALQTVHEKAVTIFEHQQFPLQEALKMVQSGSNALFDTLFTFQKLPSLGDYDASLLEEIDLDEGKISPPYAINVEMQELDQNLVWTIATQDGVMSVTDVEAAFECLTRILEFLIDAENGRISEIVDGKVSVCGLSPFVPRDKEEHMRRDSVSCEVQDVVQNASLNQVAWSSVESKIRHVLSSVSGVEEGDVTKNASLYHLGLDSISAVKVSRLLKDLGLKIPVSMILKGQTITKIASLIEVEKSESETHGTSKVEFERKIPSTTFNPSKIVVGFDEHDVEDIVPAMGGQSYMLDTWRASKGRKAYGIFSLEVNNCSPITFANAFASLVSQIPSLRTRFKLDDGKYYQVVLKESSTIRGPVQYQLTPRGEGLLVALHIHHALYDAVSLDLILRRLQNLCNGKTDGAGRHGTSVTDSKPFYDFVSGNNSVSRTFWTKYLDNCHSLIKSSINSESSRTEIFDPALIPMAIIERIARREGVSIQAIFFVAMARVHVDTKCEMTGEAPRTAVVGIYLANRSLDIEGLHDLPAPTFNVVPLKVMVDQSVNIFDAARAVQDDLRDISRPEACGVSMRDIHSWTGVQMDCCINFLRLPDAEAEIMSPGGEDNLKVKIRHADGEAREQTKALTDHDKAISPFIDGTTAEGEGLEWCIPMVDIEAKIGEDGDLAVGVFAPGDVLDEGGAKDLMDRLRTLLQGVGEM